MMRLVKCWIFLSCLLPAFALADPVRVSATIEDTIASDSLWLARFGHPVTPGGGNIPFQLTYTSVFVPDSGGFGTSTSSDGITDAIQYNPQSIMSLAVAGKTYTIQGAAFAMVISAQGFYEIRAYVPHESIIFLSQLTFRTSGAELDGGILDSRDLSAGGAITATYLLESFPSDPEITGFWSEAGSPGYAVLSVSPIPEPGQAGMLLGGLAVLLLGAARRKAARY